MVSQAVTYVGSFPSRERGLKQLQRISFLLIPESFPSRERGLKLSIFAEVGGNEKSFPSRERGLKLLKHFQILVPIRRSLRGNVD